MNQYFCKCASVGQSANSQMQSFGKMFQNPLKYQEQ